MEKATGFAWKYSESRGSFKSTSQLRPLYSTLIFKGPRNCVTTPFCHSSCEREYISQPLSTARSAASACALVRAAVVPPGAFCGAAVLFAFFF